MHVVVHRNEVSLRTPYLKETFFEKKRKGQETGERQTLHCRRVYTTNLNAFRSDHVYAFNTSFYSN